MTRRLEPVDLMVAVGVLATVIGGYVLFLAASGALRAAVPEPLSMAHESGMMAAMEWVQPALGQAIVDEAVMQRKTSRAMTQAVRKLNHVTMADQRLKALPFGYVDQIRAYAGSVETDHAARVQLVMGRTVTNFTARGVRSGTLSPATIDGEYNRTMITLAESTGRRMDEAFQTAWQSHLGGTILAAAQDYLHFAGLSQGRVGRSIVGLVLVQDANRLRIGGMQEQLASVALASLHTEQIADRFARLAAAELGAMPAAYPLTQPRAWPEVPMGVLFAASAALVGLFFLGILAPARRSEPRTALREEERPEEAYRKTA